MSDMGSSAPQELRRRHLDEYRGFERLSNEELLTALDDQTCTPDRCCLLATELIARGADAKGAAPLLRWILRGFDGNQTRYRAAIALARLGEWDSEIQGALHHITERYPRSHSDARVALELLESQGKAVGPLAPGPEMNILPPPARVGRDFPRLPEPVDFDSRADFPRDSDSNEDLPPLEIPAVPGEMPAWRLKVRKSRKTLAYPSARNAAIIALFVIAVGIVVAIIVSQSGSKGGSLAPLVEVEGTP
jgi:hypothetical protein